MFSKCHTSTYRRPIQRALLLMGVGLLLAYAIASSGPASPEAATSAARATASVSGGTRTSMITRLTRSSRRAKPAKSRASTKRAAKLTRKAAKLARKAAKPVRKAAKPPRRAKAPRTAARPERTTQPAAPSVRAPAQPNDPLWQDSWSLAKVNALAAWQVTTGRPETIVAVLDTGVDLGHPDLQGAFVPGYDFVNRDDDPTDDHGHGTMVAGVIAARSNNALGVTSACWNCSVMPVKVIGADGSGGAGAVAEGIVWAADHGANVINLSFTMNGFDGAVAAAIDQARSRGVVIVAAAGNNGNAEPTFPAAYPGVVSVAGTDTADARYGWSSYGGWVSIAAPGCSLTTAAGGTYGEFCGTSSATAFVSGLAGLVRSLAGLSVEAVAQTLSVGAAPVGETASGGRVDAAAALAALTVARPTEATPAETSASSSPEPAALAARPLELP